MRRLTLSLSALVLFVSLDTLADLPPIDEASRKGLCAPAADARFVCTLEDTNDTVSICLEAERLTFHLGKPGKIDISLPQEPGKDSVRAWSKKYSSGSDDFYSVEAEISFKKGNRSYVVAHTLDDDKQAGFDQLIVKEGEAPTAHHRCSSEKVTTGDVGDIVGEAKQLGYSVAQE